MSFRNPVNKDADIQADNILIEIEDQDILKAFVDAELTLPSPRKVVEGKPIYATRQFGIPKEYGRVVLGDFGSAVRGDKRQIHDAQPDVYRCPEVMLKTEWGFPADIWNVGAMVCTILSLRMATLDIDRGATDLGPIRGQAPLPRHRPNRKALPH